MSAQSTKKKRIGSRRRLANQSETSEGGDGFHAVGECHTPEENTESLIGLASYSQSDSQHPPAPEVTQNRRKFGSSRRNKGSQAKDSGIESHQEPIEEVVEHAGGNEALHDKIITMLPRDDDMESASLQSQDFVKTDLSCSQLIHPENQTDATNSEDNYHEHRSTENMTKTTVDELLTRDEPTSKMQSTIETTKQEVLSHKISVTKSEIQEVDHRENESDCELQESDVCESVNNEQGGMDEPHTPQSEEGCDRVTGNAHLVDITELQSFTLHSVSPVAQPLGDQSKSNEMPDEELNNVYSVTDQGGEKPEEDTELQIEKNLQMSHIKTEETEFPIKRVITTEKSSPAESNEFVSVGEETLSSTEEPPSKEKHDEHEAEVVHQSEVCKQEVKSTQMEEMHQNVSFSECLLHDAPESFDVNLGNLTDNVEIGNTHQLELILETPEDSVEKQDESKPDSEESQNVKDNSPTMAPTQVTSGQDDFPRSAMENAENARKTSEETENGSNITEYEEIPKMEPHPPPEASLCREDCQISDKQNVSDHVEETVKHDTIKDVAEMREIYDTEAEVPHFEQDEVGEQCENPSNTEHEAQEINASHEVTGSDFFPAVQTKSVLSDTSAGFEICRKENTTEFPEPAVDVSEKSATSNTGDTDDVGQDQEGPQDKTQDREDYNENVQIKSKQRKRKMGSTRKVHRRREEETESKDEKGDLNTEADTRNLCSSEAELETQAEPEFGASDLHVELEERNKAAMEMTQTVQLNPSNTSVVEVGGFCKSDGEEVTANDPQTAERTMTTPSSLLSRKDDKVTEAVKGKMEVMDAEASQHETSTTSLSRMHEQEQETNDAALGLVCEGEGQVEEDQYNTAEHKMHQEEDRLFSEDEDSKSSLQTLQSEINIPLFSRPQEHSVSAEEQTNISSKTAGETTKMGSTEKHLRCEEENTEKMKEEGAVRSQNVQDNSPTMATSQVTSGQDDFLRSTEEDEENTPKTSEETMYGGNLTEYEESPKMEPHPAPEVSICREDCQISDIQNVSDHVEETVEHDTIEDLAEMTEIDDKVPHFDQDEVGEQCEIPSNTEHEAQEINASHELTGSDFFPAVQTKSVLSDTSAEFEICHKENTTEFPEPAVDVSEKSATSNTGDTDDVGQNQEGPQDKTQDREDYNENVQIKSKQRKRKMGSTRKVHWRREGETGSKDEKGDLNTEADTGNLCSSEAELETQAEPEFSASDLHVEMEERNKAVKEMTQTVQLNPSNTSVVEVGGFCKSDGEEITANDPQTAERAMTTPSSLLSRKDDNVTEAVKGKMEVMDAEASQHETSTTSLSHMHEQEQEANDAALGLVCEGEGQVEEDQYNTAEHKMHQEEDRLFSEDEDSKSSLQTLQSEINISLFSRPQEHSVSAEEQTNISSKTAGETTKMGSAEKHLRCEEENTEKMKEEGAVRFQNVQDNSPTMATSQVTSGQDDFLRSTEEDEENTTVTSEETMYGGNLTEYEESPKMAPHPAPEVSICREDCQISDIQDVSDHVEETVEHDTIEDLAEMREIDDKVPHFDQDEVGEQCEIPSNTEHEAQEINASHELTGSDFFPAVQTKSVLFDTSAGFGICRKENTTEFPEPAVDVSEKSATSNTGDTDDVGQNQEGPQDKNQDREDYNENVQIKSKQRRRKMGSTRKVHWKREEETGSKDEKGDLNTEADTRNLCSSEAKLETQAEPEFSGGDLHVELEERNKAAMEMTQTVQRNPSGLDLPFSGSPAASHGEDFGIPAAFVQPAGVRDGEENVHNVDVSVATSQLDVITSTETHTTCSPSQLLPPNTEKYITADPGPQNVEREEVIQDQDGGKDKALSSDEAFGAPVIEIVRAEVRGESGEKDQNAPITAPKLNDVSETAHSAIQNASQASTSANRRRKLGSTRKNIRSKAEDLHEKRGEGEAMETVKNLGDEMTESVSDVKGKELQPEREHEEQEREKAKELTPLSLRSAAENAVARDQIEETERRLSPPDLRSKPALSPRHDVLSESSSGGRRRKMGSHRKTGGHKLAGRRDGRDLEGDAETLEEHRGGSEAVDKTSEVEDRDNAPSSNISISMTREPLKPAGLLEQKEKEPVHLDPEVHRVQKPEKTQFLGDTRRSDLRSNSYNVVMVGNSSVGKTSFMNMAQSGTFSSDVCSSLGIDSCKRTVSVDGKPVVIQLWDTAGQERFHSITRQIFHKAQAFLLMYDITSSQSFSAVRYWADCIQGGAAGSVIVMLLGNKSECAERQVHRGEGEMLAKAYNFAFDECSAATGDNVLGSLEALARMLSQTSDTSDTQEEGVALHKEPQQRNKSGCC